MSEVNKVLTQVETGFNIVNSVPLVALATAPIRAEAFKVLTVAGVVMMGIGLVGQMVRPNERIWKYLTLDGKDLCIHSALNVVRALGELLLAVTVVGSIGLFFGQLISSNKFAPLIKYDYAFENRLLRLI